MYQKLRSVQRTKLIRTITKEVGVSKVEKFITVIDIKRNEGKVVLVVLVAWMWPFVGDQVVAE